MKHNFRKNSMSHSRFSLLTAAVALCAGILAPVAGAQEAAPSPAAQDTPAVVTRDGSSPDRAAASCWAIKQDNPDAKNGSYWLLTPQMEAPQEFFCDQEMDGGGWVMIGRGREGWDRYPAGQDDISALTSRDRTPADFAPAQLPTKTIDGLLSGQHVNELDEGMRVVRATNSSGTRWQTADIKPQRMENWSWALSAEDPALFRFDNEPSWYRADRTDKLMGSYNGTRGLDISTSPNRNYKIGFGYGMWLWGGSTRADSYLWSNNGYGPLPYAELYLRPQLSNADAGFESIPDAGLDEVTNSAVVSSFSSPTQWGVTGNLTGSSAEGNAPVQAFAQKDDTVFVGGNFTAAENHATGESLPRTAVAAFDATTGEVRREFAVDLDGQVKALLVLPNGKLLIGGDFLRAGGKEHRGTVLVDPDTGAIDETWTLNVVSRLRDGIISVKALSLSGDHVYLGGKFTHLTSGGDNYIYARSAGRVSLDGVPDRSWNPEFNGTVVDTDVSDDDGRFYAAGYFTKSVDNPVNKAAVLSTAAGAAPAVDFQFQPSHYRGTYQQAIEDSGELVFIGGAEHSLFGYEPQSMNRVSGSIMSFNGGDVQAIASNGEVTYASCHCNENAYQDSYSWPTLSESRTRIDNIQWVGAWDAKTGKQLGEFSPYMLRSNNGGGWSLFIAEDGALWAGGDFTGSRTNLSTAQWNGGFVRYPAQDREAPGVPDKVTFNQSTAKTVGLTWAEASDAASYEVLRDDRVVATTSSPRAIVPRGGDDRYFVRAVDEAGNRSATTRVAIAPEAGSLGYDDPQLIAAGADWQYSYNQGTPDAAWNTTEGTRDGWQTGAAPLGYGGADLGTEFQTPAAAQRPITAWFAHTFDVADPTAFTTATLSLIADDGAVVYVNGHEVGRVRMDEGDVKDTTRANAVVSAARAAKERTTIDIPSYYLKPGENIIAVETHLNYRSSPSLTFDASLLVTDSEPATITEIPVDRSELIAAGADWRYSYAADSPADDWTTTLDVADWNEDAAPIGWGAGDVATPLTYVANTAYFVKDIELSEEDLAALREQHGDDAVVRLEVRADDAALVRLNDEEVGRVRLGEPRSEVAHTAYADSSVSASAAARDLYVVEVPLSRFHAGSNRLAVETHLNYKSAPSFIFDLSATVTEPSGDPALAALAEAAADLAEDPAAEPDDDAAADAAADDDADALAPADADAEQ